MGLISTPVTSMVSSLAIKRRFFITYLFKGNEAPAASVHVLRIKEGEEPPEANDERVRLCQQYTDETPLTSFLFLVGPSSSTGTPGTLGKTLLHCARNTCRQLRKVEYTSRWRYCELAMGVQHILCRHSLILNRLDSACTGTLLPFTLNPQATCLTRLTCSPEGGSFSRRTSTLVWAQTSYSLVEVRSW